MTPSNPTLLTYRYERWRAVSFGVIETAGSTFLLLIAVRWFNAGMTAKAMVAAGSSFGFLVSPWVVSVVEAAGTRVSAVAARIALLGGVGFLFMAAIPTLPVFVAGSCLCMACTTACVPLLTQIYQDNYPARERGRRFAWTVVIRMAAAAAFGQAGGWLLSDQTRMTVAGFVLTGGMSWHRAMFVVFALAFFFSAWCLWLVPSSPLSATRGGHPFKALRCVRQDALFRRTLVSWMFMGFANLMMIPLRVEYLANPEYLKTARDAVMTAGSVAMLTTVVPNLSRLVTTPFWGWAFDRMNFFMLRIVVNCGFMLGILSFFTTGSHAGLVFGSVVYGVSIAGGDVAWSLWVTKFAPPERVADYMATHTFLTGVRGVIAPLVAFELASRISFGTLGWISAGLIAVGTLVLVPEVLERRQGRRATALVEEDIPD